MPDRRFFEHAGPFGLGELSSLSGIAIPADRHALAIARAAPLARAEAGDIAFLSDRRYVHELKDSRASAIFGLARFADQAPPDAAYVSVDDPQGAWARAAARLHPPKWCAQSEAVHPDATVEDDVRLSPGVVVGQAARIGRGSVIGANTVIGAGVAIGRDCVIGANVSIAFALIGDRVKIAAGAVIGEPGFGVAISGHGLIDVPQLGRAIIQDGVTIGANTCIDRGAWDDTVIGENTKIDNLVQVAHNVVLGRNCVLAAFTGISGSAQVGDGVMFGGRAGLADHLKVGAGARIAAASGVMRDVGDGETWAGNPARPIRQWLRETAWVAKQAGSRDESGGA